AQIAAGRFASIEDMISAGAAALEERDEARQEWLAYAQKEAGDGFAALDRGEGIVGTPDALMDEIERELGVTPYGLLVLSSSCPGCAPRFAPPWSTRSNGTASRRRRNTPALPGWRCASLPRTRAPARRGPTFIRTLGHITSSAPARMRGTCSCTVSA